MTLNFGKGRVSGEIESLTEFLELIGKSDGQFLFFLSILVVRSMFLVVMTALGMVFSLQGFEVSKGPENLCGPVIQSQRELCLEGWEKAPLLT